MELKATELTCRDGAERLTGRIEEVDRGGVEVLTGEEQSCSPRSARPNVTVAVLK